MIALARKVIVVTPTSGTRPFCLHLCQHYLHRQTVRPNVWLIGSETVLPETISGEQVILPDAGPLETRMQRKLRVWEVYKALFRLALKRGANRVVVMEDDDWYASDYIETRLDALERAPCVTGASALHWHVGWKSYRIVANGHEHVSQIAFRREALSWVCGQNTIRCLRTVEGRLRDPAVVNVEIKGLKECNNLSKAVQTREGWIPDPSAEKIRAVIPPADLGPYV